MNINEVMGLILKGEGETIEFKRDPADIGKTVSAFANTNGGTILIGVDDNGNIAGLHRKTEIQKISDAFSSISPPPNVKVSIVNIGENRVAIVNVNSGHHLYSHKNIVYMRVGSNNRPLSIHEVVEKASESLRLFFDELLNEASLTSIDKTLVKSFLERRETVRGILAPAKIDQKVLLRLRILKQVGNKTGLTNGGLLFFGSEPQRIINTARIHLVHFSDQHMQHYTDQRIFEGSLWKIVEEFEVYLRNTIRRIGGGTTGFRRAERFEYPIEAIREAVLNAIVHRNYFDAGDVKIFLFPDHITIKNPGSFPPGVTPEIPEHRPRNPLLAQYFYDVGLIEKYGSGIEKMRMACRQIKGLSLDFELHPTSTTVVFQKREAEFTPDGIDKTILQRLSTGPAGTAELAELVKMTRQAVIKRLNKLLKADLILREGSGAKVRYLI